MKGRQRRSGTAAAPADADIAATDAAPARDNQFMIALERGMNVLEVCARAGAPIGTGEIAALTGLSLPTASRITYTLASCGYLDFVPRERTYVPGTRLNALAAVIRGRIDFRSLIRPELEKLAAASHCNVGLGVLAGDQMTYLEVFEGEALVGLKLHVGYRIPILKSAMGLAYLAALDEDARDQLIADLRRPHPDEVPTDDLERRIEDTIDKGYCLSMGLWHPAVHSLAAPVRDPETRVIYTLVLGGPAYLLPLERMEAETIPLFLQTIKAINDLVHPSGGARA